MEKTLISFFVSANIFDSVSTYIAIKSFGKIESNPIASSLFNKIGMEETMLIKIFLALLISLLYVFSLKKFNRLHWSMEKSLKIAGIGTWIVAILNFIGIAAVFIY